jgi:thioredoxin 1
MVLDAPAGAGVSPFPAARIQAIEPHFREVKMNEPIHVNDANFEQVVIKSAIPVVVDFWAPWCGPCRMVAPSLETLAREFDGKVLITKVNTDENPQWASGLGVQGIPTMIFFHEGKIVHQQVGALPLAPLRSLVQQLADLPKAVPQAA